MLKQSVKSAGKYFSLVKFSHTVFAMPFALIGFFVGIKMDAIRPDWLLFVFVLLCMVFARNAAMAFNRYVDNEMDKKNPRTLMREIPSGIIKPQSALRFSLINSLLFIATTWFINPLVFKLSPLALLVILGYSVTKKFTALCHFILGLGLSLAPIGAYLSVTGRFDIIPLFYSFAVLFWVTGFDIIYALQDEEFDRKEKLRSIPVMFGGKKSLTLSLVLHIFASIFIFLPGILAGFGAFYWIGCVIFSVIMFYQHFLVKPDDLSRMNLAFFTTNGVASILFALFTILDLYL